MPGAGLEIPRIESSVGYYFDAGTFLWAILVIGAAFFFFLGTFNAIRQLYKDGRQMTASLIWFGILIVLVLGVSLLARAFRNLTTFVIALALIGVASAFGWHQASKKKEDEEEDRKK